MKPFHTLLTSAFLVFSGSIFYWSLSNNDTILPFLIYENSNTENEFCGSDFAQNQLLSESPGLIKNAEDFEKKWQTHLSNNNPNSEDDPLYILPVVVHIIHENGEENISNAQVEQAINWLNDAFANTNYYDQNTGEDTQIQFCLAIQDPVQNSTAGINRIESDLTNLSMANDVIMKDLSRWKPKDYVNIWVVKEICRPDGNCGPGGYAYLPYSHGSSKDGIVIEHRFFGESEGETAALIHETGHYLGLYHTFEGGCENGDCAANGDRICDTPPDQSTAPVPCDGSVNTCSTDANSGFPTDQNDMFWNYMDYGDLGCFSAFTPGQIDRMHFSIENYRSSLLNSKGCLEPCPNPISADFDFSDPNIGLGETVTFINNSEFATEFEWTVNGVFYSNEVSPNYTFSQPGNYEITLLATADGESCFSEISQFVSIICNVNAGFSISNSNPKTGETVWFTPTNSNALTYSWEVDGQVLADSVNFEFVVPKEAVLEICLTVFDGICTQKKCEKIYAFTDEFNCISPPFSKKFDFGDLDVGNCLVVSDVGEFYIYGTRGEDFLRVKVNYSGDILEAKTTQIPGGVKEIREVIFDFETKRIGCGTTLDGRAFVFRDNFSGFDWLKLFPEKTEGVALFENQPAHIHFFYNSFDNPDSNGEGDDFNLIDLNWQSGEPWGQSLYFSSLAHESLKSIAFDGEHYYGLTHFQTINDPILEFDGLLKIEPGGNVVFGRRRLSPKTDNVTDITVENEEVFFVTEDSSNTVKSEKIGLDLSTATHQALSISQQWKTGGIFSVPDGFIIYGSSLIKVNKNGTRQWARTDYGAADYAQNNQMVMRGGNLIFLNNEAGNIGLNKTNMTGENGEDCSNPITPFSGSASKFDGYYFPTDNDYSVTPETADIPPYQDIDFQEETVCFEGCTVECNDLSVKKFDNPDGSEIAHTITTKQDRLIIGGGQGEFSFLMELDSFGTVKHFWTYNFGPGNEHIQNILYIPGSHEIIGYGNFVNTDDETDFWFRLDANYGFFHDKRRLSMLGNARLLGVNDEMTFYGSLKTITGERGVVLNVNGGIDYTEIIPNFGNVCFLISGYSNTFFGGVSAPGGSIDNFYGTTNTIPWSNFDEYQYTTNPNAPREMTEQFIVSGSTRYFLIKSEKETGSKCRHYLFKDAFGFGSDWAIILDYDIEYEENVAFRLIRFNGNFLVAGTGESGANFLSKITSEGDLEWTKKFQTDHPLSFSVLEDYVYFATSVDQNSGINKDFVFGRINSKGEISSDCDLIQDFTLIPEIISVPVLDTLELTAPEDVFHNFTSLTANISDNTLPELTPLCLLDCFEICGNGNDDDNDGFTDEYDSDCSCQTDDCASTFYLKCEDLPCEFSYELTDIESLRPDTLWTHPMSSDGQTPMVGDVDGDCSPDIIFYSGTEVWVLDSRTGTTKYSLNANELMTNSNMEDVKWVGHVAVGDTDLDGLAEIFVSFEYSFLPFIDYGTGFVRLDFDPATAKLILTWVNVLPPIFGTQVSLHTVSLADFNRDARPEIYLGNWVYSSETGNLSVGRDVVNSAGYSPFLQNLSGSSAADVLTAFECQNCHGLELIAGNQVFSVSIFSEVFPQMNSIRVVRELTDMPDGYTAIADFDLDGDLDAIVTGATEDGDPILYVWDIQTETLIGKPIENLGSAEDIGIPSIGDIDGDGLPEIIVPAGGIFILEDYQNGGGSNWGESPQTVKAFKATEFDSAYTAFPLFDINGDGKSEIFMADLNEVGILDEDLNWVGEPISWNLSETEHSGIYPVIADIDADGFTEVLIKNKTDLFALRINAPMPKTRRLWNQHNYFITNVLDNETIPQTQQQKHLPANGKLNGHLMQLPVLNQDTMPIFNLTDAELKYLNIECSDGEMIVETEICNLGNSDIPPGISMTFYEGNPFDGNAPIIEIFKTDTTIHSGECRVFQFEIPPLFNIPIFAFFNDKGTNDLPMNLSSDFPNSWLPECDFSNNFNEFTLDFVPPVLDLGNDTLICGTGVIQLNAGDGFFDYRWNDDSEDSFLTTWLPGIFWVEATDSCGGVQRDTILIEMTEVLPVSNHSDTVICLGESVTINAISDFKTLEWFPKNLIECDTCLSNTVFPDTTVQIILVGQSDEDCVSVDTILIEVIELKIEFETTPSCNGQPDGTISTEISGGAEPIDYQWNTSNTSSDFISELIPGEYFLTVTDANGCFLDTSIFVEQNPIPEIDFDIQNVSCFDEKDGAVSVISENESLQFGLNENDFKPDGIFENLGSGVYPVYVLDSFDCVTEFDIQISEPPELLLDLPPDTVIELSDFYQIFPNHNASQNAVFEWSPNEFLDCFNCENPTARPLQTITYTLVIIETDDCRTEDKITIEVINSKAVFIPNVFSPNGDGINDVFYPFGGVEVVKINQFKIFDRWGNLVFEQSDFPPNHAKYGWDGTFNGQVLHPGIYVFFAEIEYLNGEKEVWKGEVVLVR